MTLHDYLYERRITRTEFARQVGVRVGTLNGWMTGRRHPTLEVLARIERHTAFAVNAASFVGGSGGGGSPSVTTPGGGGAPSDPPQVSEDIPT